MTDHWDPNTDIYPTLCQTLLTLNITKYYHDQVVINIQVRYA